MAMMMMVMIAVVVVMIILITKHLYSARSSKPFSDALHDK